MNRPPSDFELLRTIRDMHHAEYVGGRDTRQTDVFVPIDIPAIARKLGSDEHTVFGRLYYHLDEKFSANQDGKPRKALFAQRLGNEANCVNFPLLEAVLAGLWEQRSRDWWTYWTSAASLGIAIASLVLSVLVATGKL